MRVRRDTAGGTGDDDEADIAFDSGVISLDSAISNASAGVTATTLGEFINVGTVGGTTYSNPDSLSVTASCFVDEWKDQSGNANHASQATFGSQPQIHSGTVNTDLITENGKPAVDTSIDAYLELASEVSGIVDAFTVARQTASSPTGFADLLESGDHKTLRAFSNQYRLVSTNADDWPHTATSVYFNGSVPVSNPSSTSQALVYVGGGSRGFLQISTDFTGGTATARYWAGNIQEIVLYDSDQSSNRTGIETNTNGFFGIY